MDSQLVFNKLQDFHAQNNSDLPSSWRTFKFPKSLKTYIPEYAVTLQILEPKKKRTQADDTSGIYLESYSPVPQINYFFQSWSTLHQLGMIFGPLEGLEMIEHSNTKTP